MRELHPRYPRYPRFTSPSATHEQDRREGEQRHRRRLGHDEAGVGELEDGTKRTGSIKVAIGISDETAAGRRDRR